MRENIILPIYHRDLFISFASSQTSVAAYPQELLDLPNQKRSYCATSSTKTTAPPAGMGAVFIML
jgi:hypothetical protein